MKWNRNLKASAYPERLLAGTKAHLKTWRARPGAVAGPALRDRPPTRDDALDGLRGLAAMIVAVCHFVLAFQPGFLNGDAAHGGQLAAWLARTPAIVLWSPDFGVAVFFVLSGVVLAASADRTDLSLPPLLLRRWLRLALPILGSTLLIWSAVEFHLIDNAAVARANGSSWLAGQYQWLPWPANDFREMVHQSLIQIFTIGANWWNAALWTIPIEMRGSIGVFVGVALLRLLRAGKPAMLLAALVASVLLRATPYAEFAAGVAMFAAARIPALALSPKLRWCLGLALAIAAVLAGGMPLLVGGGPYAPVAQWMSGTIANPTLVVHVSGAICAVACAMLWPPARRGFASAGFVALGRISFMSYLCHIALLCTLVCWVVQVGTPRLGYGPTTLLAFLVFVATLLPVAALMTRFCDLPAIAASRAAGNALEHLQRRALHLIGAIGAAVRKATIGL